MADIGYVTLEYANEYVATHFLSTDDLRTGWEALSDEDKGVLLLKSFEAIETLVFTGHKSDPHQPNAFPRCPDKDVPEGVKAAQVENAVSLSDSSASEDAAFYERLWQFGVESYSIGNLSEKTSEGAWAGVLLALSLMELSPQKPRFFFNHTLGVATRFEVAADESYDQVPKADLLI